MNTLQQINQKTFLGDQRTHFLFQDVKNLIPKFKSLRFTYVHRFANKAAHDLAQWAKTNVSQMVWSIPRIWLLPTLCNDHSVLRGDM